MEAKATGSSPTGGEIGGGKRSFSTSSRSENGAQDSGKERDGPKPKISNNSEPGKGMDKGKEAEVEQHNKEFEQRHDRAAKAEPDKVDEKFWKGESLFLTFPYSVGEFGENPTPYPPHL